MVAALRGQTRSGSLRCETGDHHAGVYAIHHLWGPMRVEFETEFGLRGERDLGTDTDEHGRFAAKQHANTHIVVSLQLRFQLQQLQVQRDLRLSTAVWAGAMDLLHPAERPVCAAEPNRVQSLSKRRSAGSRSSVLVGGW